MAFPIKLSGGGHNFTPKTLFKKFILLLDDVFFYSRKLVTYGLQKKAGSPLKPRVYKLKWFYLDLDSSIAVSK